MKLEEAKKRIWGNYSLSQKIVVIFFRCLYRIREYWWLIFDTCPHEGTIKAVKGKKEVCLLCHKITNSNTK